MRNAGSFLSVTRLVFIAALLAGCTGMSASTTGTSLGRIRVAVVPPGFGSPFHIAIKDGATSEAQKLGWQVDVVAAEQEGDFSGQVAVVEQELQKGVAAIAINPIDATAIVTAVKKANQHNTPVFMHNTITPVDQGTVLEYIGYNQWAGAAKLAKYTCDLLLANHIQNGKVYILMGILGFHADRRTQGYEWGLQKYCPDVKVVGKQTAEWDRTEAVDVATAALQQNPGINFFYGNSDEMGIGACIAAKKMGRTVNEDIWCISIDGNPVTLELIEKGDITATLGVYPTRMGATVIDQMAKVLRGEKVPFILETPSVVVDKTNLANYRSGSTWTEPTEGSPEYDNGKPTGD
jgi:ABC-type sugar transport system substrate-binding protein